MRLLEPLMRFANDMGADLRRKLRRVLRIPWTDWLVLLLGMLPLPRRLALRLSSATALLTLHCTREGRQLPEKAALLLGLEREEGHRAARRWLEISSHDRVLLYRMARGADDGAGWRIVEHNREAIDELRREGRSLLVISGHFHFAAWAIAFRSWRENGWIFGARSLSETHLAKRMHFNTTWFDAALLRRRGSPGYIERSVDFQDHPVASVRSMVKHLRQPGKSALLLVDLVIPSRYMKPRSFASQEGVTFFLGGARIPRLAGCLVVPMVAAWVEGDEIHVEWGTPTEPAQHRAGDVDVMNALLDQLETAMGRHMLNYSYKPLIYAAAQRHWNGEKGRWEPLMVGKRIPR